ncbi:MAG TPA: beta-N-acetylhexosaminidase [Kofleriaceae bacterium]|nr:beta-N-acetylhexosaminidase [Kofleriaceae bacterium]
MRDDVGQLLWIGFHGTTVPDELTRALDAGRAGVTIVFKRNLVHHATPDGDGELCDLDALVALNAALHRSAPDGTPALIALDQEGGLVQRVRAPATVWPPMAAHDRLAADDPTDTALAEQVGLAMGRELRALGFDIDFAPVLDVHTNPLNPIIGNRAFATEPHLVARRALAFARGLTDAGILACGKHFPGHGDTATDSHLDLPRIDHDWERLEQVELLPFARAAASPDPAIMPMLMTAHVVFAALDPDRPATLSPPVITGLLRNRLHYNGVILSDDLDMRAIVDHVGVAEAAVQAIRAGCDALLLCRDEANQAAAEAALLREAERDSTLRTRIAESAARIRAMKRAHLANQQRHPAPPLATVGSAEHKALAARLEGK